MQSVKSESESVEDIIRSRIREIHDYPKKGVVFKDITPLVRDPNAFSLCIDELARKLSKIEFDYLAAIESRGFIIGSPLAYRMKKGLVLIRKQGKLPYKKISKSYELEYGNQTMEMHTDSIEKDSRIVIVDDLLATGGTANAGAAMVRDLGGKVAAFAFITELSFLKGRESLGEHPVISLVRY